MINLPGSTRRAAAATVDGQRSAAEHDQHHDRRHERAGQLAEDDRRLLRARQPAARCGRRGDGQHGRAGRGSDRQGAVQIQLHHALGHQPLQWAAATSTCGTTSFNANTWFNNRDLPPDPATGKAPKARMSCISRAPASAVRSSSRGCSTAATRRSSSSTTKSRASPGRTPRTAPFCTRARSRELFRYTAGGQTREVNLLDARRADGHFPRPSTRRCAAARRHPQRCQPAGRTRQTDRPDPAAIHVSGRHEGITRYPTTRVDVNLTDKHRVYAVRSTTTTSCPTPTRPTTASRCSQGSPEPAPRTRFATRSQGSLRSTLGANLVNELRIGGTGGATLVLA